MDVIYFFQVRVAFLRQLYSTISRPYSTRKQLIEAGEHPYETSQTDQEHEPAFLNEWFEAEKSLQVVGQMTVSALAAAFHLFVSQSNNNIKKRVRFDKIVNLKPLDSFKTQFKKGWFNGYKAYFLSEFQIQFESSGCDLSLLETLVLTRNIVQHPTYLSTTDVFYSEEKGLRKPFFIDPNDLPFDETESSESNDHGQLNFMIEPRVKITVEKMNFAFETVLLFAEWLEKEIILWSAKEQAEPRCSDTESRVSSATK